jgi:DNA ligase (NAD+)
VADLYDLTRTKLIGLGEGTSSTIQEKGADNIMNAIELSKQVPFERVLFALGIRYVGEVGAKKLARHFGDMDSLMGADIDQLAAVEDVGQVTAAALFDYFRQDAHRLIINRLRDAGLQMQMVQNIVGSALQGLTFVVSGVFQHFSRDQIKSSIEQNGGKVTGSLSGKTSYLLAGENMGPEKLKKAEKLGIPIISESDYEAMITTQS